MQSCHTIDRITGNNGRCAILTCPSNRIAILSFLALVAREFFFYAEQEPTVDLLNDLIDSRKQP